jgi:hypothetical protein
MPEKSGQREMYRYRTKVLTGPWAPTIGAAIDDAIRAGQASIGSDGQIRWIVAGEIERNPQEN